MQYFMQGNSFYISTTNRASKKRESNFDASIGAYDGAEVCELIGIFMLSLPSKPISKNHIGLYRDDGLAILTLIGLGFLGLLRPGGNIFIPPA